MGQLDGRIGIVTGAASGIGAACARVLSREGAKLVLTDLDDAGGQRLAEQTGDGRDRLARGDRGCRETRGLADPDRQCRHRHHGIRDRHVACRLAAADVGECRRRVPDGEIRHPCDAAFRRRFRCDDVLGRRDTRFGEPRWLFRDEGRGAAIRQVHCAGVRAGARDNVRVNSVHPGVIDTPI